MDLKVDVVSDLHLGLHNSRLRNNPELLKELIERFREADVVILNGDILDILLGSTDANYGSPEAREGTLVRGRSLIEKHLIPILDACPHTRFLYIDGNHETGDRRQAEFIRELFSDLETSHPHFQWIGKGFKIGDYFITHSHDFTKSIPSHRLHDWPQEDLCRILYDNIAKEYDITDVKGIVFGHAHRILAGEYNGIKFYNTGAMIKNYAANIVQLHVRGDLNSGTVTQVTQQTLKNDIRVETERA